MTSPGDADAPAEPPAETPAAPAASPHAVPLPTADDLPLREALPFPGAVPPAESSQPQPEPEDREAETPPVTRSACVQLGMKLYAIGAAVPILAALALPYLQFKFVPIHWSQVGLAAYLLIPPSALLGAAMGFEAYRLVCRSRRPLVLAGWVWGILFLLTTPFAATLWLTVPLFLHSTLRRDILTPGATETKTSLLHLVYILAWPVVALAGMASLSDAFQSGNETRIWLPLVICGWAMFWICDYLLLLTFASWRLARLLEKPPSHTVQYSLGTLMLVIFGVGLWVSGLLAIFRP